MEEQNFVSIFNILHNFEWFYPIYKYSFIKIIIYNEPLNPSFPATPLYPRSPFSPLSP